MSKEKRACDMTAHYNKMIAMFTGWCDDCDGFLKGEECLFPELVNKDKIYHELIKPWEHDTAMVKPLLELIFTGFVSVSKRMLFDHVEGEFKNPSESVISESQSVPTTNVAAERDFGMLDRLMKLKPKALDLSIEAIVMFNTNKTKQWRDKLSPENLAKVIEASKKSKKEQKRLFIQRKQSIHDQRAAKLSN